MGSNSILKKTLLLTILLLSIVVIGRGQDIETLREQVRQAENEIQRLNALIEDNQRQQKNSLNNLKLVDQKLTGRKKIISNYDKQIEVVVKQMGERGNEIASNTAILDSLRGCYRDMVRKAYINYRGNTTATFILSSTNFQEVVRGIYYTRLVGEESTRKARHIDSLSRVLNGEIDNLKGRQQELSKLMDDKNKELEKLSSEQKQHKVLTDNLKGQEQKLAEETTKNRVQLDALQKQIEKVIAEEIASGSRRPEDQGQSLMLSGRLEQNKGRLPSPVRGGVVVDRFGVHDHPQQGVKLSNKGINIACKEGSAVTSVFEGEVRRVFVVPGMGSNVIIRHGNYLTVYSNLQQVSISQGDKVSTGQKIGSAAGAFSGQTTVHFELWHEAENLDPEQWLSI